MQINETCGNTKNISTKARLRKKVIRKMCEVLNTQKPEKVDQLFHDAHKTAFQEIDCLVCANCCKTTSLLFNSKDVERIVTLLKMKPGEFTEKYLRMDEDRDYVLQRVPCTFLLDGNRCSIYEVRPKACREYTHTDRKGYAGDYGFDL